MKSSVSPSFAVPFLLFTLAIALRFYGLDRLSLWADELWVVMGSVQGSLADMFGYALHHDNHPPGYYLLLRYTQSVFGDSDFIIRCPSALAGSLLVLATYASGKKYISPAAAAIAAALVTGSYQAIYYSQEARPNIFMALFSLLAFYSFYAVMFAGERTPKNYCRFVFSALASSYFHYAGLVFCVCLALLAICLVALRRTKEHAIAAATLFVPVAVLYLPWISGLLHHLANTPVTAWQRQPDIHTLQTTFCFLFGPDTVRIAFFALAAIAGAIVMLVSARQRTLLACLLGMIVLPVAVFYLKSVYSQDAYNHRHFLFAIPLLSLIAGAMLDRLLQLVDNTRRNKILAAIVAVILGYQFIANNNGALYTANHFKQEFRETARIVADDKAFLQRRDTLVITNTPFFDHYLKRFIDPARTGDLVYDWSPKITALDALVQQRHATEFYYLEAPIVPGANQMITAEDMALATHYQPLCRTRFARAQAFRFSTANPMPTVDWPALPICTPQPK